MKKIILAVLMASGTVQVFGAIDLSQAGRVIAHENGLLDFIPPTICPKAELAPGSACPEQFDKILAFNNGQAAKKQIHFVKLSLRTLNDKSWVVAHDNVQYIAVPLKGDPCDKSLGEGLLVITKEGKVMRDSTGWPVEKITLSDLSSAKYECYQKNNINLHAYRLSDYIKHDPQGELAYMLYFKTDPNIQIINDIDNLGINPRTVLESRNNSDADWIAHNQGTKSGIWFTGRVSDSNELTDLVQQTEKGHYQKMWGVEVNVNNMADPEKHIDETRALINQIHEKNFITELDDMPYHSCVTPLEVGTDTVMSNSPKECLNLL